MTGMKTGFPANGVAGKARIFRRLWIVLLFVATSVLVGCAGSPEEVDLEMPDLMSVADGIYRGTARVPPVIARVEVSVSGGRISGFKVLQHLTGQGQAAEALADRVVEKQTIELDAVTGATYSSKAILKAGEKALCRGLKR